MQKIKALILFSGGLDSMLAVKLLQVQGIEVDGVCFTSNFFGCEKVKKAVEYLGIKLKVVDISKEILEIVKNPPSGYGKHLNPCIDCHSLMIKMAGEIAKKGGYSIIATGEVLGQRPFSQNRGALARVEKLAGVEILRPLSAKKLPETVYEKQGLVNRGRLKNISGRSREQQMELVSKYGIKEYAAPAGGCLLTDPEFSQRLGRMLDYWPDCDVNDAEILKNGRVLWLKLKENKRVLIVIGRHQQDNENLERLAKSGDVMIELKEIMGPLTVVRIFNFQFSIFKQITNNFQIPDSLEIKVPEKLKMSELRLGEEKSFEEILKIMAVLTGYYATKARGKKVKLKVESLSF